MTNLLERSAEEQMILESVAKIAAGYGHDAYVAAARRNDDAAELWQGLAEAGFIGVTIPEEYGGAGMGVSELALVLEETAAQGCPMMNLVAYTVYASCIIRHGSPEQKAYWLPKLASGEARMAFAVTEADAGTNTFNVTTKADRTNDGWVLSGQKHYITGVDVAEGILVVARTGQDPATGRTQLSLFIVPTDAPGVDKTFIPMMVGAPENQYTVYFDQVKLPAEALVGEEGQGLKAVFSGLNPERIVVAAMCNGLTRYALGKASEYARERTVWKAPIGTHQAIAHPLAEAYARLQASFLVTRRAAEIYDSGEDAGEASNIAKFMAADLAVFAMDRAIQTHGGNGMSQAYGLADLWFITRLQQIAPINREMTLNHFAQHGLKLGRSY